jgi:hypothetical protein
MQRNWRKCRRCRRCGDRRPNAGVSAGAAGGAAGQEPVLGLVAGVGVGRALRSLANWAPWMRRACTVAASMKLSNVSPWLSMSQVVGSDGVVDISYAYAAHAVPTVSWLSSTARRGSPPSMLQDGNPQVLGFLDQVRVSSPPAAHQYVMIIH